MAIRALELARDRREERRLNFNFDILRTSPTEGAYFHCE